MRTKEIWDPQLHAWLDWHLAEARPERRLRDAIVHALPQAATRAAGPSPVPGATSPDDAEPKKPGVPRE